MASFLLVFPFVILVNSHAAEGKSADSPTSRNYVVVFDIDSTLCITRLRGTDVALARKNHPECPIINWTHGGSVYAHIFLPHLQILFEYLLERNARIVFFSSGVKERNEVVIPELLVAFWGSRRLEELKAGGQFDVFSRDDRRAGNRSLPREGEYVKDLGIVVRKGESLLDVILVEDDQSFAAHDQEPCLFVMDLFAWKHAESWPEKNEFPLNNVYYLLGVFKTYFEDEEYRKLRLRKGIEGIVPREYHHARQFLGWNVLTEAPSFVFEEHPFTRRMIDVGLQEVRKRLPDARFYELGGQ